MGLRTWVEKRIARLAWARLEGAMPQVKRWAPVIGAGLLAVAVLLRLFGLGSLAQTIEGLAGSVGLAEQSPVGVTELAAAAAAVTGVVLKIRSEIGKAKAEK